jgi:hypothetical protein
LLATPQPDTCAPTLRAAGAARAGSPGASSRVDAAQLRRHAGRVLAESGVDAAAVSALLTDADHRSSRLLEAMALAHDDLPHLDAGSDVRAAGPACGASGAVSFLAALALGRQRVLTGADAVLCVANGDPVHLGAALIRPSEAS